MTIKILYKNLFDEAETITPSSEVDGFFYENLYSGNTTESWKFDESVDVSGFGTVELTFTSPVSADCFCFYGTSLHETSGNIALEYHNGTSWVNVVTVSPTEQRPYMVEFPEMSSDYWRIVLTSSPAVALGDVRFGKLIETERGAWIGETPLNMAENYDYNTSMSDKGALIGAEVTRTGIKEKIDIKFMSFNWVEQQLKPFIEYVNQLKPFYLMWASERPDDIAFVWLDKRAAIPKITHHNRMSVSLNIRGLVK